MKISLRTKLAIFSIASVCIPLLAVMLPSVLIFRDIQKNSALEREAEIAASASKELASFFSEQFKIMSEAEILLLPHFAEEHGTFNDAIVQRILFKNPSFIDFSITDFAGSEFVRKNKYKVISPADFINRSQEEGFQIAKEQGHYLDPSLYFEQGRPLLTLGLSITGIEEENKAIILAEIDARIMQEVVSRISAGLTGGSIFIVNREGIVIAHPNISEVLSRKDLSHSPIVSAIKKSDLLPFAYKNEIGEKVLGAWSSISESGWYVVVEERASHVLRYSDRMIWFSLGMLLFVFMAAPIGSLFISRRIVYPIELLSRAAKRFVSGKFSERVSVQTQDELQDLASVFNQMAHDLSEYHSVLEEAKDVLGIRVAAKTRELQDIVATQENKIEERTADLKKSNKYLNDSRSALMNILEDVEEARKDSVQEKDKTLSIITNFADGLLVFDEKNSVALINPAAEKLLGIKRDEIIGKSSAELSKFPALRPFPVSFFGNEISGIFRKEINLSEELSLEATTVPLIRENTRAGFLVILHDVTREKKIEKMKTEFVSLAAHQLRTPLSAIKWTVRMILDGDAGAINDEQKEMLQKSYLSNERMIGLVNDLLNVTRIEEGKYLFKPVLSDIAEITRSIADSYSGQALKRNIKLEFSEPAGKIPELTVDAEKIGLALQNILDNAVKYTTEGGTVFVAVSGDKENVKISVKDTGVGIPANQQGRVFSKFFRADNVVRMETEGSGLGLFIAQNIIEAHGGKIWFESKEGEGTTFFFSLPIKPLSKTN